MIKLGFLTVSIYFTLISIITMLTEIAYNESIFDYWWLTFIWMAALVNISYGVAKKLLK